MAFVADHVNFRTFDLDRKLELFVLSCGSDGTCRFRVTSPGKEHYFSAHYERLNISENSKVNVGDGVIPIVWIIHRWYDEWKPVIREAMLAYVINHGSPNGHFKAFVRFGEKGALNDA
ncbi:hypothetical protein PX699_26675 [Sphingobium sp. H39-3-25]|uniref:hypothetical protein n=1 Tax=Sphingobium arseniciresistens TaxID=3030834 RepID=UPI0023B915AA|nr:hypothetical protein [Sphingobium arseniciresistens]|tara:strand:- start:24511 stop:24864 length:354 start_codon:yes stop_codon:yes gene_type:complete